MMKQTDSPEEKANVGGSSARPADVASIDAIITTAYDCYFRSSGKEAGLGPRAGVVLSGGDASFLRRRLGKMPRLRHRFWTSMDLLPRVEPYFATSGFYEKEIARRTEQFGCMAQVWSTYESRHDPSDPEPFMRGINSIQLFNDGNRWWIVNIYWQQESLEYPIPEKYLENGD